MNTQSLSRVRRFDCNPGHCVRISSSQNQNRDVHCAAVSFIRKNDSLMHYGVPGQKWGVITKEYQPVAVDHRKTRGFIAKRVAKYRQQVAKDEAEVRQINEIRRQKTEKHRKTMQKAAWIGAAAISLFVIYKGARYAHIKKARAYTGLLNNFLKANPSAVNPTTEEGRKLLRRGLDLAKENSRNLETAQKTGRYLKRAGLGLSKKESLYGYKVGKLVDKSLSIKTGGNKFTSRVNKYRHQRIINKLAKSRMRFDYGRG